MPPSDPISFFTALLNSAPMLAAFLFCVYLIARWFGAYMQRAEERDKEREGRYYALVDAQLKLSAETVEKVTAALTASTEVMKDVRDKLNEKSH